MDLVNIQEGVLSISKNRASVFDKKFILMSEEKVMKSKIVNAIL